MTFIQREDFISDLRYNIHAAKLHFFCVRLLKSSSRIAEGARLWITSVAKVAQIVWNYDSYSEQHSYHQAPWSVDTRGCIFSSELITPLQVRRIIVKHCWQSTAVFSFFWTTDCRYRITRSVQNCKKKRKLGLRLWCSSIVEANMVNIHMVHFQLRHPPPPHPSVNVEQTWKIMQADSSGARSDPQETLGCLR